MNNKKNVISIKELKFSFSRSSGSGGQNVNKVNSKVTLRWNIFKTESCSEKVMLRFVEKYSSFILDDGYVMLVSQKFRQQSQNIDDCIEKLEAMVEKVRHAPLERRATKPTFGSVEKRIRNKKGKGQIKKMRQEKFD